MKLFVVSFWVADQTNGVGSVNAQTLGEPLLVVGPLLGHREWTSIP